MYTVDYCMYVNEEIFWCKSILCLYVSDAIHHNGLELFCVFMLPVCRVYVVDYVQVCRLNQVF